MAVVLGGDTWPATCQWLGLSHLVHGSSPKNRLVNGKVRLVGRGMDDYICGGNVSEAAPAVRMAAAGKPLRGGDEFVLCDHILIRTTIKW